ncbi:MAG: hypothetical protein ACPLPW_08370 [bacterium]
MRLSVMGKAVFHVKPFIQGRGIEEIYLKTREETEEELKNLVLVFLNKATLRGSYEAAR